MRKGQTGRLTLLGISTEIFPGTGEQRIGLSFPTFLRDLPLSFHLAERRN